MKHTLALMTLALTALAQQPPPASGSERRQKIIQIKYADVETLARALSIFGGVVKPEKSMRLLSVEGSWETITAVEDAIKRLDVPAQARNVETLKAWPGT